jgi:hypothetical protein
MTSEFGFAVEAVQPAKARAIRTATILVRTFITKTLAVPAPITRL